MIEIFTDGACRGNPGPGGWGAVIVHDAQRGPVEEIGGAATRTTNNRMELQAALEALRHVPPGARVQLFSDSQYLLNGMTRWIAGWRNRGWLTREETPVENRDLWEALDELAGRRVTWTYVRGHAGHPGNERANVIAQAYAAGSTPPATPYVLTPAETPGEPRSGERIRRRPGPSYLSLVNGELRRHRTWDQCRERVHGVSGARYKKCADLTAERETIRSWGLEPGVLADLDA